MNDDLTEELRSLSGFKAWLYQQNSGSACGYAMQPFSCPLSNYLQQCYNVTVAVFSDAIDLDCDRVDHQPLSKALVECTDYKRRPGEPLCSTEVKLMLRAAQRLVAAREVPNG